MFVLRCVIIRVTENAAALVATRFNGLTFKTGSFDETMAAARKRRARYGSLENRVALRAKVRARRRHRRITVFCGDIVWDCSLGFVGSVD